MPVQCDLVGHVAALLGETAFACAMAVLAWLRCQCLDHTDVSAMRTWILPFSIVAVRQFASSQLCFAAALGTCMSCTVLLPLRLFHGLSSPLGISAEACCMDNFIETSAFILDLTLELATVSFPPGKGWCRSRSQNIASLQFKMITKGSFVWCALQGGACFLMTGIVQYWRNNIREDISEAVSQLFELMAHTFAKQTDDCFACLPCLLDLQCA